MESLAIDDKLVNQERKITPDTPEEELERLLRMGEELATSATKIRIPDFDYDERVKELKGIVYGGWIYIARNESHPDYYKIGISKYHPDKRMKSLSNSTSVPTPYELLYACKILNYREIETALKEKFSLERKKEHYPHDSVGFERAFVFIHEFNLLEDPVEEIVHDTIKDHVFLLHKEIRLKKKENYLKEFMYEKDRMEREIGYLRESLNDLGEAFDEMQKLLKRIKPL